MKHSSTARCASFAIAVMCLVASGAAAEEAQPSAAPGKALGRRHFETRIAPLFARHCLECHDSVATAGGLDLSRKERAFTGGESGPVLIPGKALESPLWKSVNANTMPHNRAPLSDSEKELLKEWIDAGASWPIDVIDASAYVNNDRAGGTFLQRLTVREYIETVRATVGVDIATEALRLLPRDQRADGFSNTAYNLGIDLAHVEAYARLARLIVAKMDLPAFVNDRVACRELNESCLQAAIASVGEWLLRGPLDARETAVFLQVANSVAAEGGEFHEALGYVVEAMLQSPRFLYRVERQQGDGVVRPVDSYELASRMSYILWGGPPDRELLRLAGSNELRDLRVVERQVRRMLSDPRSIDRSRQFVHEWMDLDRLASLRPNPERFPQWNEQLANDMRDETLAYFQEIVWTQQRSLADLLNAQVTYATPRLARHYGLLRQPAGVPLHPTDVPGRQPDGLQVLYRFHDGPGDKIRDHAQAGEPLDLTIQDPAAVRWEKGGLTVHKPTLITTVNPPARLIDAIKKSKALTLEAWITPASARQAGPARILTLSSGSGQRNFTLGQEGGTYDVRLRAGRTDGNGLPSLSSQSSAAEPRLTHVVYVRESSGMARLYVDGQEQSSRDVGGDLSRWDGKFLLGIANETTKDRPWLGNYHQIAIYSRALAPQEIGPRDIQERYDLVAHPARGGLLTQGSVLSIGGDEASMVARGLFVLHDLLYSRVGNPPPCVNTTPVRSQPGMSQRAIAMQRLADASCVGCHVKFEPLAFGLEKFDGIGAYHEQDQHGNVLREDGEILFPGAANKIPYQTSAELMDLLAASERVRMGITRKLTQFALGRPLVAADIPSVEAIHRKSQEHGGTYQEVMRALILSDLVQMARTDAE